jgi:predicted DNA-binding transcriptional regulator AlpA
MERLIVEGLSINELLAKVREIVKQEMSELSAKPATDETLIDVKEVARLCGGVTTITIHNWSKPGGILNKYKVGGRVFWKQSEVIQAMAKHRTSPNI